MFSCNKCKNTFKYRSRFKIHNLRKTACKPATHFCSMCQVGLTSRRTLLAHKRRCRNRPGVDLVKEDRIEELRKRIAEFFEKLSGDCTYKLDELEKLFPNACIDIVLVENIAENTEKE